MGNGENQVIVSDVVPVGPAMNKFQKNDILVRINGRPTYNMNQGQAVDKLRKCGNRVELSVKRKVLVRVERDTPPPGPLRRSRSRDLDHSPSEGRSRYRSRSRGRQSGRYRSHSRDLDSPRR